MGRWTTSRSSRFTLLVVAIVVMAGAGAVVAMSRRSAENGTRAAGTTPKARRSSTPLPPPPITEVGTRSAGIDFDQHDGPFGSAGFHVADTYQGPVNGAWYLVFAGQKDPYDRASGTLRIYSGPLDLVDGAPVDTVGDFAAPGASDLEVTAVQHTTLTLVDQSTRHTYFFDLGRLQFTG